MFANISASSIAASFSIKMLGEAGVGVSIVLMTIIVVIFCEIMPKIIAINNAKHFSLIAAPFIRNFSQFVLPIRWFLSKLTERILYFFENRFKNVETDITKDELETAIKVGYSKGGILDKEEAEMMEDVLQLSNKKVEDVMIQEKDIVSFPVTMSIEKMYIAIKEAELSRIPVYEESQANILGILYAKDLLNKKLEQPQDSGIKELLRKPFYVTKDMRLNLLLRELRTRKVHLALVNDEKGKLVGLVTLEDLLEEIIGDIRDKETLVQRIKKRFKGAV
jgi:CBS domain containing-hemolysin-like protein